MIHFERVKFTLLEWVTFNSLTLKEYTQQHQNYL